MTTPNTSQKNLNVQTIEHAGLTWVNLENPGVAEMDYLREKYGFHDLALDDCLSDIQIPKLDDFGRYLFFVGHFPIYRRDARLTTPSEVDIFSGENFIVTVHDGTLRPLVSLFSQSLDDEEFRGEVMRLGSGYLLYRILDALVDYIFPILNRVIQNVNDIENQVFDDRERQTLRNMALVRRDILTFRRVIRLLNDVLEEWWSWSSRT